MNSNSLYVRQRQAAEGSADLQNVRQLTVLETYAHGIRAAHGARSTACGLV